jgi:hypothetical protein
MPYYTSQWMRRCCDGAHDVTEVILFFIFASDLPLAASKVFEAKASA